MKHRITEYPAFKAVGLKYYGKNENKEISAMWCEFCPRMSEVKNVSQKDIAYGICIMDGTDGNFTYIAALPVTSADEVPDGMVAIDIPAGKYAVFTHKGSLDTLLDTFEMVGKSLADSGLTYAHRPEFELYDERFKPDSEESEIDLYIPIE